MEKLPWNRPRHLEQVGSITCHVDGCVASPVGGIMTDNQIERDWVKAHI